TASVADWPGVEEGSESTEAAADAPPVAPPPVPTADAVVVRTSAVPLAVWPSMRLVPSAGRPRSSSVPSKPSSGSVESVALVIEMPAAAAPDCALKYAWQGAANGLCAVERQPEGE